MARRLAPGVRDAAEKRARAHDRNTKALAGRVVRRGGLDRERIERALTSELDALARQSYRGWRRVVTGSTGVSAGRDLPDPDRITKAVEGALAGATWRERVRRGELTPARVAAIARTEANRINNAMRDMATRDALRAAERKVVAWVYTTQLDDRVRPSHRARHGKRFKVGERRIRLPDGTNCRCYYLPVWGRA